MLACMFYATQRVCVCVNLCGLGDDIKLWSVTMISNNKEVSMRRLYAFTGWLLWIMCWK